MTFGDDEWRQRVGALTSLSPQAQALKLTLVEMQPARATIRCPYHADLVGDADTGVIAGGVMTVLLDHACGQAVLAALTTYTSIATLDLRIDYMRPAEPGLDLMAAAHCYRMTRSVAFVRAVAYDASPDDPVATSQAAFMLNSDGGRRAGANLKPHRAGASGERGA